MEQVFDRCEKKYLLDLNQYVSILDDLSEHIVKDRFYKGKVCSIYYDTKNFALIRRSLESPDYKEKLRIRAYGEVEENDDIFVELKKKYAGIVYKRRTTAKYQDVLKGISECDYADEQIGNEIKYFYESHDKLYPMIYISCLRTSYRGKEDYDLRITFDEEMKYRIKKLKLKDDAQDKSIDEHVVMEIKTNKALPIWLCEILDKHQAYPRGFSKVGMAFMKEIKQ